MRRLAWLALGLGLWACDDEGSAGEPADAAPADAAPADAAPADAAPDADATPDLDADAPPDADAGRPLDAGPPADAAPLDPGATPTCPVVRFTPPPPELDPFYTRHVDVDGVALVGSDGVPEAAFRVAAYLIYQLSRGRPCLRAALARSHIRVGIMARDEVTTDLPEYSDFYEAFPGTDWDARGRGFGATQERPLTSTDVANLLKEQGDPWLGEVILLHELAHTFLEVGVLDQAGGGAIRQRVDAAYADAMAAGRWANTYAATNANEYWAEGVQSWLDDNLSADPPDGVHGPIDTRAELEAYDPALAAIIADVFSAERWPTWCDPEGAGPAWTPPADGPAQCDWAVAIPPTDRCGEAARSLASDAPATVTVVNRRLEPVDLFWLDFDGAPSAFGTIPPRRALDLRTFASHPWLALSEDGTCRGLGTAEAGPNRLLIE